MHWRPTHRPEEADRPTAVGARARPKSGKWPKLHRRNAPFAQHGL